MAKGKADNHNGVTAPPSRPSDVGTDFQGDWPADGFILPGTSTVDAEDGSVFKQGSHGRGNFPNKRKY